MDVSRSFPLVPRRPIAALALGLVLGACLPQRYTRSADREVGEILRTSTEHTLGNREASVARPRPGAPRPAAPEQDPQNAQEAPNAPDARPAPDARVAAAVPHAPRVLGLREALEVAVDSNRDLVTRKEALYLTALALTGTRFSYSPQVSAALSYVFSGSNDGPEAHSLGLDTSVSQLLPSGGNLALNAFSGFDGGGTNSFSSSVGIQLTQPLLRGAGREAAWESLVQAERSLVYAIRDFELFREGFTIDVAARFYDLVQQKQSLENQRRNLESFVFGRKQAEALFSVGRVAELEVLRAKRSELTSQNSLIEAEESLRLSLDRFRIFLGLPDGASVDVRDEEPRFVEVDYDVASAVEVALQNRLDWLNRQEELEDARRGERIAQNGLLPDLALELGWTAASDAESSFGGQGFGAHSYSAGLSFKIPLQEIEQRNAWRSAEIALASATRSVAEFKDNLIVSVQSTFRELERRKQSLEIQKELIVDQQRNVKIAQLLFEQGNYSNRDVVEAQQALLDAQNALIREKVGYEIARLGLLRDLGILFIDEKGMWKE